MIDSNLYPHIAALQDKAALQTLPAGEIPALAQEIRDFLVERTEKHGGHLASNLGVVELSLALHRVFDTPSDRIIWDVGHQAYVHKILTGRADAFDALRCPGGLSGFPVRNESEHDAFGTGHSSTALSAAVGFAEADRLAGNQNYTIAVVGDGAMTGGMVHEALNNCRKGLRLILILNDNNMSISRNIGRVPRYFNRIRVSRSYRRARTGTKNFLCKIPLLGKPLAKGIASLKNALKRLLSRHNYFEDLGFLYIGPIDGHDEHALEKALKEAKRRDDIAVLHIRTKKGKGYAPAETDPTAYHGLPTPQNVPSFHRTAGETLCEMAKTDAQICAVTAAMKEGTGLSAFAEQYPDRFFDVGIAEEHAATFCAALAAAGLKPYFAVYSTFLQRSYDQILHDIALQKLPVRLLIDRAGLAASDGPTHHGIFDIAMLSSVPHMTLWSPATLGSLRAVMQKTLHTENAVAVRYPNTTPNETLDAAFYPNGDHAECGVRSLGRKNARFVVIAIGTVAAEALAAVENREDTDLVLVEQIMPYADVAQKIMVLLPDVCPIVYVEEGIKQGGACMHLQAALVELESSFAKKHPSHILAVDGFAAPSSAIRASLRAYCGIDANAIASALDSFEE